MTTKNKTYSLEVYNPTTRQKETVTVSEEVYHAYRRTGWGIKNNDHSFYKHEIQMSNMIGGEDNNYENFREFLDTENVPERLVLTQMQLYTLRQAIAEMAETEKALILAIYFEGLTEGEYSARTGVPLKTINNRKLALLRKLKEKITT